MYVCWPNEDEVDVKDQDSLTQVFIGCYRCICVTLGSIFYYRC